VNGMLIFTGMTIHQKTGGLSPERFFQLKYLNTEFKLQNNRKMVKNKVMEIFIQIDDFYIDFEKHMKINDWLIFDMVRNRSIIWIGQHCNYKMVFKKNSR
jgi:hypothetical protein